MRMSTKNSKRQHDIRYPRVYSYGTRTAVVLHGRVATFGRAKECAIPISDRNLPDRCAHLLFREGRYNLQLLSKDVRISINDTLCTAGTLYPLEEGDKIDIEGHTFEMQLRNRCEERVDAVRNDPLMKIIDLVVTMLRNRDRDVSMELVMHVSRLLSCDAARLVSDSQGQETRVTVAQYPGGAQKERFSERAIDWAAQAAHTIVMCDTQWGESNTSMGSLDRNAVGSVLCTPLDTDGRRLGYLYLDRVRDAEPFSEKDRMFCETLRPLFSQILINNTERRQQREIISRLQKSRLEATGGMIFESAPMAELIEQAQKIAQTQSPVLILGETGTGKELMAHFMHAKSARANGVFKALNCGAIPETLIESELFGYEKGAFTGANKRKAGVFEAAAGGSVFLDEIGELPVQMQVKLLRVLQEGELTRVGGTEPIKTDVRIIAASNRNLQNEVVEGRFRQDLFFRLNVFALSMPPLRERQADVVLLGQFFIRKYCDQFGMEQKRLGASARDGLISHTWPGNVRELENVIQKAVLLSSGARITAEDLDLSYSGMRRSPGDTDGASASAIMSMKQAREAAEKRAITNALTSSRGNISLASKLLKIDRKWLMKKMDTFDIDANTYRE